MSWNQPLKWIDTTRDGDFFVVPQTASLLAEITQPVVVIAIAGLYRTGKSYLMNRLAGTSQIPGCAGFSLGSTLQSETKGIWIWCVPHPNHSNQTLVLIDTEGLGDPEKGDEKHDMTLFSLAVLLSSTFVFNAIGKIDQEMINKLYFVTELTERIKVKSSTNDDQSNFTEFTQYFPSFILAVRDFTLELKLNGRDVTPNEYFNHILALKKGQGRSVNEYNLPREAIREAFRDHYCFVFTRPVLDEALFPKLANNELNETDISPKFQQQSNEFCYYVLSTSKVKMLGQGQQVNGPLLLAMSQEYVKAINSGAVPCIESTVTLVAERENIRVMKQSIQIYASFMKQLQLPVTSEEIYATHALASKESSDYFSSHVIFDDNLEYSNKFMEERQLKFEEFLLQNETESAKKCRDLLSDLYKTYLGKKVKGQSYACAGGYKMYCSDMAKLLQAYDSTPGKGVLATAIQNEFLREKEVEASVIMSADEQMTEKDAEIEAAEKSRKIAELEKLENEKQLQEERVRLEMMKHDHDQQLAAMHENFEKQQADKDKEMTEILEKRMEEQKKLLQEGFDKKAADLADEIKKLQEEKNNSGIFDKFCSTVGKVAEAVASVTNLTRMRDLLRSSHLPMTGKP